MSGSLYLGIPNSGAAGVQRSGNPGICRSADVACFPGKLFGRASWASYPEESLIDFSGDAYCRGFPGELSGKAFRVGFPGFVPWELAEEAIGVVSGGPSGGALRVRLPGDLCG